MAPSLILILLLVLLGTLSESLMALGLMFPASNRHPTACDATDKMLRWEDYGDGSGFLGMTEAWNAVQHEMAFKTFTF